jgi:hypothetical protein
MFKNYNEIEKLDNEMIEEVGTTSEPDDIIEPEAKESELVLGVVTNCVLLNIREEPNIKAPIITKVNALSELMVDLEKVDKEWYRVYTEAGIEGFCMKKFVAIKQ